MGAVKRMLSRILLVLASSLIMYTPRASRALCTPRVPESPMPPTMTGTE